MSWKEVDIYSDGNTVTSKGDVKFSNIPNSPGNKGMKFSDRVVIGNVTIHLYDDEILVLYNYLISLLKKGIFLDNSKGGIDCYTITTLKRTKQKQVMRFEGENKTTEEVDNIERR